jgi:transcription initiation factor TFIIIB Brf1 subunit/transcription initiation factor TFIIB
MTKAQKHSACPRCESDKTTIEVHIQGKRIVCDNCGKSTHIKCPECGHSKFVVKEDLGERICKKCGLVLEDNPVHLFSN